MSLSPKSYHCLSPSTEDEGPFALDERYRNLTERRESGVTFRSRRVNRHPLTQSPIANMTVDGAGLRALSDISVKAEVARDKILKEIASLSTISKLRKCLTSGKSRQFLEALYELEHAIAITAEEVRTDQELFKSIEPERTRAAYKQVCKSMRGLSRALSRMTTDCGHEKYIRICRKFVVRILRRIVFHYGVSSTRSRRPVTTG